MTIETTEIRFRERDREYIIIDAPGHREFVRNMITGAARSDAALLVLAADEGIRQQSKLHARLLRMLGVAQLVVLVNKMDRVSYSKERFDELSGEIEEYLSTVGLRARHIIPISASAGDNFVESAEAMSWYRGPHILSALKVFSAHGHETTLPLRLPVQDVYFFGGRRIIVGRIETGVLRAGDKVLISPSNEQGRVATIEVWPPASAPDRCGPGEAVGFTLEDEAFIERGAIISHPENPPALSDVFRGQVFWLGRQPALLGKDYQLKLATQEATGRIQSIETVLGTTGVTHCSIDSIDRNEVAEVVIRARKVIALDPHHYIQRTGRFVLLHDGEVVGGGIASMEGFPDQRTILAKPGSNFAVGHKVTLDARQRKNGHGGGVLWLTGLSGAGKSTLAMAVEQTLFARGAQVYVLDGDNVRSGLSADLGFSPEDRAENIRRVAETAALFADAGMIVIVAMISPYRSDRDRIRTKLGRLFHEIYVRASLETCEKRDPKGLYRRARAGELPQFTGVSAPYEPPESPDLIVDTTNQDAEACIRQLVSYIEDTMAIK